jgi:hypothetical protein
MLPLGVPKCPTCGIIARGSKKLEDPEYVPADERFLKEYGGLKPPPDDGEQEKIKKYLGHGADAVPSDQGLPPQELDSEAELRVWLDQPKLKLTAYAEKLVDLGVTHPVHAVDLSEEDFQTLGMKKLEIKRLRKHIQEFDADAA